MLAKLADWAAKRRQKETSAEDGFIGLFFGELWGYTPSGHGPATEGFTRWKTCPVQGAGAGGGTGQADLALGWFGRQDTPAIPQVLCEFKDIRSDLDAPQHRKGSTRSPVRQCADYLRSAAAALHGWEGVEPWWGLVTDMNEIRLYWRNRMPGPCLRFVVQPTTLDPAVPLVRANDEDAAFQRFLLSRLFRPDMLLGSGREPELLRLHRQQGVREREIEQGFYAEYRRWREVLIETLRRHNPRFPGTPGRLVRLAQKLLDRCIFALFCEDMGRGIGYPPNLIRDILTELSQSPYYDPQDGTAWERLKALFRAMDAGGRFAGETMHRFNGGLFAHDPELDGLSIPTAVFCARNQGATQEMLEHYRETLLYFAAAYNFGRGAKGAAGGRAITLYTLGRIFEQSITELEYLEAKAENRPSLTEITKRKRDGVYYTPEWVVERLVAETLGPRLAEMKAEAGWDEAALPELEAGTPQARTAARQRLDRYAARLESFTVCDPACGSGAFLIHVLEYLLAERQRVALARTRLERKDARGQTSAFDAAAEAEAILSRNIYGVDVNPASVEIAQLALWLHTARAGQTLADLTHTVRCGNSLVDPSALAALDPQFTLLPAAEQESVNPFDWRAAFPEAFARGGFDAVVGNPPYVKLQNYVRVQPRVARLLREGRGPEGEPLFASAQTGNTDLFLPFIEQGLRLLNADGRLGFIAPSLWTLNEYGEGLRRLVRAGRHLERWVDFGSHQIFAEATTYTALMVFSRRPAEAVLLCRAPDGAVVPRWHEADWQVPYADLPVDGAWLLAPGPERQLVRRLSSVSDRLGDRHVTRAIMQGLITSLDVVYQLRREGVGLYKSKSAPEVPIEDAITRPLISGAEAQRYASPQTDNFLLFPYVVGPNGARLIPPQDMERRFPKAWAYLRRHQQSLRDRERRSFDDDAWYRFGRSQNLDKQHLPKLIVAQTVQRMEVAADADGRFCLDNVRVNGILAAPEDFWFLAAVLNSRTVDWVFRRVAKPKANGFFEANKQFIAPLPIPRAGPDDKAALGRLARRLTVLHTGRRRLEAALDRRIGVCRREAVPDHWLWPDLGDEQQWLARVPPGTGRRDRAARAKAARTAEVASRLEAMDRLLRPDAPLAAEFRNGELRLLAGDRAVLDRIFLDAQEGARALLSWRVALRRFGASRPPAERLVAELRRPLLPPSPEAGRQLAALHRRLGAVDAVIAAREAEVEARLDVLYGLTAEERALISADRSFAA